MLVEFVVTVGVDVAVRDEPRIGTVVHDGSGGGPGDRVDCDVCPSAF